MPRFSIVIPCFNAEQTITETLDSVRAQSCSDWEAICIDDGSSDRTLAVLTRCAAEDARIRVLRIKNGGPSKARNLAALHIAQGEILAFLDADDLWARDKLAVLDRAFAGRFAADAYYAEVQFFSGRGGRETQSKIATSPLTVPHLLGENPLCTLSNLAVSTERFRESGGFDDSLVHCEDLEWLIRFVARGGRIEGIARTLVHYRASPFGLSADLGAMYRGWRSAIASARSYGHCASAAELRRAEAVQLRYLARRALRMDARTGQAAQFAWSGVRCNPAAFFTDLRRSLPTFLGALAAPFMPRAVRRALFCE
ncbi:MAG: glycosyltransferase [Kiloniellales bacterium]